MKKLFFLLFAKKALLFALMFLPVFTSAAPKPSHSPKVGYAIGGVIEQKGIKAGFAANDPRINATLAATTAVVTTVALAASVGASAPFWVTLLIGSAVAAVISLVTDFFYDLIFNGDGTYDYGGIQASETGAMVKYGPYYRVIHGCISGDPRTSLLCSFAWAPPNWASSTGYSIGGCFLYGETGVGCNYTYTTYDGVFKSGVEYVNKFASGAPQDCPPNTYIKQLVVGYTPCLTPSGTAGHPRADTIVPGPGIIIPRSMHLSDVIETIPDAIIGSPINPQILADATNKYWREAASKPGYVGLPYSYSNPVTAADVQQWQQANLSSYPSVSDFITPAINPQTGTVPITTPGRPITPNPNPGPNPGPGPVINPNPGTITGTGTTNINVTVDLGADPGIGSPNLESTPTGMEILAPITGLMPDLRNFQVPSHQGECPKPEFDIPVLNTRVRMDAQCTLLEEVRGPLYNASLLAWIIAALFIVLSA